MMGEESVAPPNGEAAASDESAAASEEMPLAAGDGDLESLRNIVRELIGERDATAAERDDFKDSLQRLKADFENFKRRVRERERQIAEQAAAEFAEKLIPVLEGIEAAISAPADTDAAASDQSGIEQIAKLFFSTLEAEGMETLKPLGELFDPNLHEAIEHIPAEATAQSPESSEKNSALGMPVVVEVFRTGYRWKGKLLRPALVKVQG